MEFVASGLAVCLYRMTDSDSMATNIETDRVGIHKLCPI